MDTMVSFGEWLRRRRKALDMTQDDLARRAGCAVATIRKIEAELRRPSRQLAERLAGLLSVTPEERQSILMIARTRQEPGRLVLSSSPLLPADRPPSEPEQHNLPGQLTSLVGRDHELALLCALMRQDDVRIVTLTGAGGTGKTRLSLEAARQLLPDFARGVYFIPLAPLNDSAMIIPAVARTLGVKEQGSELLAETLARSLRDQPLLLVLDNMEHLSGAEPIIGDLLSTTRRLKLIVTSRFVLRIRGEKEFRVPPLRVPHHYVLPFSEPMEGETARLFCDHAAGYEAVRLFVARAQDIQPDFALTELSAPYIVEICQRLDGLPLAIELAVARLKLLSLPLLLERLSSRLDLLVSGPRDLPKRHRTLRGAIDWSHDLLDQAERRLFWRMAVFCGSWTLEAAESIAADLEDGAGEHGDEHGGDELDPHSWEVLDGLTSLLEKSFLYVYDRSSPGGLRLGMLETLREYALERLQQSGEVRLMRQRHAEYYLEWIEQVEPLLTGEQQQQWMQAVEADHDNLRAAIGWALEARDGALALRLTSALWRFWQMHAYLSEGRRWLAEALALDEAAAGAAPPAPETVAGPAPAGDDAQRATTARARALLGSGWLAWMQGDPQESLAFFQSSLAQARALDDRRTIGRALHGIALLDPEPEARLAAYAESLAIFRGLEDAEETAWSLLHMGSFALDHGDPVAARPLIEESMALFQRTGNSWAIAMLEVNLGRLLREEGDYRGAAALLRQSVERLRELGDKTNLTWALWHLGLLALYTDHAEQAAACFREGLASSQESSSRMSYAPCLEGMGYVALLDGAAERAALLWGAADSLRESINVRHSRLDLPHHRRLLERGRALLGDERFDARWDEGRAMELERAVRYALE